MDPETHRNPRLVRPSNPIKPNGTARRTFARYANWTVGLAAALLVLISAGGYFHHREQLAAIATEHLRLIVTGPSSIQAGVAAEYTVSTTAIDGRALPAEIEVALLDPNGERLKAFRETADENGRLKVVIPADAKLPPRVMLKVTAQHRGSREEAEAELAVEPDPLDTRLTLDRSLYRPGETVHFRSQTLSRFRLAEDRRRRVRFKVVGPDGAAVPGMSFETVSRRGIAGGDFTTVVDLPDGRYSLVVRGEGDFPADSQEFFIRDDDKSADEIGRGDSRETLVKTIPTDIGKIDVVFHPEGGELVAGLENRVYFVARNRSGGPVRLSGEIVEDGDPHRNVASVETTVDGLGVFSFVPHAGKNYRLKITEPPAATDEPQLPEPSTELQASLTAGVGVFDAAAPLKFHVQSSKAERSLVAVAYAQGAQVGQQPMLSAANRAAGQPVQIDLDDAVGGAIRLVIFDYGATPPEPLAERIVYRRPGRKLNVRLIGADRQYAPGESVELSLLVTDEKGCPVPAALGISVAKLPANQIERNAGLDQEKSPAKLDLLLGTCKWRRFGERPPLMFDNVEQINSNYEKSLADYRADRTGVLDTLTAASFFGGLALVVLVAMLGLMRIVSGIHLWVSAVGATTCCMILGAILMDPDRPSPGHGAVVPFASYQAPLPAVLGDSAQPRAAVLHFGISKNDFAETIYWRPLLIADQDGKAAVRFDLPKDAAVFDVWIDAHGAGRVGVGRATITLRIAAEGKTEE